MTGGVWGKEMPPNYETRGLSPPEGCETVTFYGFAQNFHAQKAENRPYIVEVESSSALCGASTHPLFEL